MKNDSLCQFIVVYNLLFFMLTGGLIINSSLQQNCLERQIPIWQEITLQRTTPVLHAIGSKIMWNGKKWKLNSCCCDFLITDFYWNFFVYAHKECLVLQIYYCTLYWIKQRYHMLKHCWDINEFPTSTLVARWPKEQLHQMLEIRLLHLLNQSDLTIQLLVIKDLLNQI